MIGGIFVGTGNVDAQDTAGLWSAVLKGYSILQTFNTEMCCKILHCLF